MSESDPHFIPEPDRADGEPGIGGLWRHQTGERAAQLTAPEIWEAYCRQFPGYWEREIRETLQREGSVTFDPALLRGPTKADRTPLHQHLNKELRAGLWACFGFSEREERRVRIAYPWRDGLMFDDSGGMVTPSGARYLDVLFYRVEIPSGADKPNPRLVVARGPDIPDPPGPKPGRVNIKGRVRDLEPEYVKGLGRPVKRGDKAQIARAIAARLKEEDPNLPNPNTLVENIERYLHLAPARKPKRKADRRSP